MEKNEKLTKKTGRVSIKGSLSDTDLGGANQVVVNNKVYPVDPNGNMKVSWDKGGKATITEKETK